MSISRYAPGPITVDGLYAVAIHINQVSASFIFDGATKTAQCAAEMQFTVGSDSGYPYFDLRQNISAANLDGLAIAIGDLAHHDFGGGVDAELRILKRWLIAGSTHTLHLTYPLQRPDAPNARAVVWEADSPRLSFDFHLSDLNPARYLESWLPSNLLFDQFPVQLEVQVTHSDIAHHLLTNGTEATIGYNHWQVNFDSDFTPCSPLLLIEAADRVETYSGNATIGGVITINLELMKRATDLSLNLATAAATLAGYLDEFYTEVGSYMHGNRFVAYLTSGSTHSMEYDGGTTSSMSALEHEVFHSWWARGMVPARGEDGWLDEAWTTYNTRTGGPDAIPFDMSDAPVALCENNPFARKTHGSSYSLGARVFSGLAADIGIAQLLSHMAGIYQDRIHRHFITPEIEAELIRRSGQLQFADYFDRFVYGFGSLAPGAQPDLYFRDAPDDSGDVPYSGVFWLSPDIWVRNSDDDGSVHQNPESGQDNWLYARVHNRGNVTARSFVVGFKINIWAGTQFIYPGDWFPLTAVAVGFDLPPGESRIVKVRWPSEDIPPVDSHGCLLGLVYTSGDTIAANPHTWGHNNLAQRNLTIVDLVADEWTEMPFRIGSRFSRLPQLNSLELWRRKAPRGLEAMITHQRPEAVLELYESYKQLSRVTTRDHQSIKIQLPRTTQFAAGKAVLTLTGQSRLLLNSTGALTPRANRLQADFVKTPSGKAFIRFDSGRRALLPVGLRAGAYRSFVLRIKALSAKGRTDSYTLDLAQRNEQGRIVGGITIQINIKPGKGVRA